MGISGLLTFVKPASKAAHLSDFKGQTVAIDSYCWIHKGAFGCADKIGRGIDTDAYVQYCFKFIDMLRSFKITPIMVFDGQNLPAKQHTEVKRREVRALARKRALECVRLDKLGEARTNFIKAVDVTPAMALKLIKACRGRGIDCVVAPYEADAQLAYLSRKGIVDLVITEDSDLVVFGCKKVLFKLDLQGNGTVVDGDKLFLAMDEKPEAFTLDKFRHMCILSGCDYLESLPGIGLKKAQKFVKGNCNADIYEMLPKLPTSLNLKNLVVSKEYRDNFMIADATFRHQLIFDPIQRQLLPLTDPEEIGTNPDHCCNAGAIMDNKIAFQLALGNLSPDDLSKMDDWSPDRDLPAFAFKPSIWSKSYQKPEKIKELKIVLEPVIPKTKNLNVVCDVKLLAEIAENEIKNEERVKRDIEKMYFEEPPSKRMCLENEREKDLDSSQKENEISPVLNRKRIFVKSRFFGNGIRKNLESPTNSQSSYSQEIKEEILVDNVVPQDESKSKILECSTEDINEQKIEKLDMKCSVILTQDSIILKEEVSEDMKNTQTIKETIVIEEKKSISSITTRNSCRRPGLTRKNSSNKFTASKNQPTLSRFFKKT